MQGFAINPAMSNFFNLDDATNFYVRVMGLWNQYREVLKLSLPRNGLRGSPGRFRRRNSQIAGLPRRRLGRLRQRLLHPRRRPPGHHYPQAIGKSPNRSIRRPKTAGNTTRSIWSLSWNGSSRLSRNLATEKKKRTTTRTTLTADGWRRSRSGAHFGSRRGKVPRPSPEALTTCAIHSSRNFLRNPPFFSPRPAGLPLDNPASIAFSYIGFRNLLYTRRSE